MLVSLGVENFRSFKKKTDIVLKPITVLVGKNSSGKSSFLRLFPLFRQSFEVNTMGPILWFGPYVDFGDINNVIFKESEDKYIKFYFDLEISRSEKDIFDLLNLPINVYKTKKINVELTIEPSKQQTQYKSINLSFSGIKGSITNQEKGIIYTYQGENKIAITNNYFLEKKNKHDILPSIVYRSTNSEKEKNHQSLQSKKDDKLLSNLEDMRSLAIFLNFLLKGEFIDTFPLDSIDKLLSPHMVSLFFVMLDNDDYILSLIKEIINEQDDYHKNIENNSKEMLESDEVNNDFLKISFNDSLKEMLNKFLEKQQIDIKKYSNNLNEINEIIHQKIFFDILNPIIDEINVRLYETFSSIRYMAPIRAIAERYYRFQDLQVNEVDSTGSNVAMILNSLSNQDKSSFENWVKNNFHFSVVVEEFGAHYTINIIDENGIKYNISDMGSGYSQLLPIIVSLWIETEKNSYRSNQELFFVIEQPELHLHPAYQTQLAKLFSKIISKAREFNLKIIVETHSQHFINAFGESVEEKQISKDDISIILFNKNNKETDIQEAHFDEEGILENWPIGFFSGE